MKKKYVNAVKYLLIIIFQLTVSHIHAHKHEEFLKANKVYEQGNYDKALQMYALLEDKGSGVYFNMGNAYYKKENYTQALVYWKKAQRLMRGAQLRVLLENIKKAEKKLLVSTDSFADTVIISVGPYVSYIPMLLMQLIWLLFAFGVVISCLSHTGYRRVLSILLLLTGLLCVGGLLAIKRTIQLPNCAVVVDKKTLLFAGPNNRYHQITSVVMGNQVSVKTTMCQQSDDWCKITFGNYVGWVPSSALDTI